MIYLTLVFKKQEVFMNRLLICLTVLGLMGSLNAQKVDESSKEGYYIKLSLDMPKIKDVAVINALVNFDPVAVFKDEVAKQEKHKKTDKEYAEFNKKHNIPVNVTAVTAWDTSVFDKITASDVYLLEQKRISPNHILSGNKEAAKPAKMWLVTKATRLSKTPFVWAVPVDMKDGLNTDVTLNKKNAINLVELYEKAISGEENKK